MRKFICFVSALIIGLGFNSCKCTNEKENSVVEETEPIVENMISVDRQDMFVNYGENYRWYETSVVLNNYLDEENDGSFTSVSNIFQAVVEADTKDGHYSADTYVITYIHTGGTLDKQIVEGFWIEDCVLNEEVIKLSYRDAYKKVMAVNLPKPHSRHAILRKPVGPKECNPQWVFGNIHSTIWVDAVTGEVSEENPAFKGLNLGTPLGEWP